MHVSHHSPRVRTGVACALALTVALLAGCSSSGDAVVKATNGTAAATTSAAPAATATTAKPAGSATTTAAAPKGPVDPCTLVTKADAEAVAGTTLLAGVKAGATEDASCTFSGDPNGPTAQVEIHVGPGAKKYLDIDKQLGHEFTAQSGIGDEAYVEDFAVFARKGTNWVSITLVRLDDFDPYRTKMLDLAKAIVAKL